MYISCKINKPDLLEKDEFNIFADSRHNPLKDSYKKVSKSSIRRPKRRAAHLAKKANTKA